MCQVTERVKGQWVCSGCTCVIQPPAQGRHTLHAPACSGCGPLLLLLLLVLLLLVLPLVLVFSDG